MLLASLGVVAALAFVLGLGALCLWALKRWGKLSLTAKTRVVVEVVQRIPLGPKTGLAVIRVGEKVMAVSVGEGGVRPLFELDEIDRQRVIASSQIPTPMESSNEAAASFSRFLQRGRAPRAADVTTVATATVVSPASEPVSAAAATSASYAPTMTTSALTAPVMNATQPYSPRDYGEIPSFLTAPPTMRSGQPLSYGPPTTRLVATPDLDFRTILGSAMGGATRLAVLVGAVVLAASAAPLHAQAAPPTPPPTPQTTIPRTVPTAAPVTAAPTVAPTVRPATAATAPQTLPLPALPAGAGGATPLPPQTSPVAPAAPTLSTPPSMRAPGAQGAPTTAQPAAQSAVPPRQGNGASVTPGGATSRRPMSQMQVDSTAISAKNPRAGTAATAPVGADEAIMRLLPQMDVKLGDEKDGGLRLNGTVGIVVMMGLLTLLPTLLLMMTGFTRILIVLHFLKQAMGTQSAPPAQLLGAMALLLTGFVMAPTLSDVNNRAITPWLDGKMTQVEMMKTGVVPMREFMLKQTRESDLATFIEMSRLPRPNTVDDVPLHVLMSAFVASELRTAFQIGFAIYLPFIIIDAVVASVLMSMGMFMLPPAMISLPFKLLLFVLVDGWSLTISSLVQSFK